MLQQTRVDTVLGYFETFLNRFPDVDALASAPLDDVLKSWEGLGYYARARNMWRGAKAIREKGEWPRSVESLTDIPGIGRSTAGAVASIAFGIRAPILDGNVKRVWCRAFRIEEPWIAESNRVLWLLSENAVVDGSPGTVNQALMELGALVCLPKSPDCTACPVSALCGAHLSGEQGLFPGRKPAKPIPNVRVVVGVIWRGPRFLVTKRPEGGFLGGLWELPGGKVHEGESDEEALRRELREELGTEVMLLGMLPPVRHAYSHFKVEIHAFHCSQAAGSGEPKTDLPQRWILPDEIPGLAFPAATHKIFREIEAGRAEAAKAAEAAPPWLGFKNR